MKYPVLIRILHWLMAILIVGQLAIGAIMVRLDDAVPVKYQQLYPLHKSFGLLILLLVVLRLLIRFRCSLPALPAGLASWEVWGAKVGHTTLYVLMFAVPVLGYCMSSSYTQSDGVVFFGAFLPELLTKNDERFVVFQSLHKIGGYLLLAVIAMHILAVIKHRFWDRDTANNVLSRML